MTVSRAICLGFLAVIAAGTLLLMMPFSTSDGNRSDLVTALFSSTSAACVTGLSVVDVGKYYSFWCQLFILLLMQVGGLGYMTSTTFLLLLLGRRFSLQDKMAIQRSLDLPGMGGGLDLVRSFDNKTIAELELRRNYDLNLLAVNRGNKFEINFPPTERLRKGTSIVVIGSNKDIDRLPV